MFIGENLTNIRILHGYTRKQLAEKLTITEQAVWQYENGLVAPKMEIVNQLKTIFSVKSKYFYKKDFLTQESKQSVDIKHIAYRATAINTVQKTQTEATHVQFLDAFLKIINKKLNYPANELCALRNDVFKILSNDQYARNEKIIQAAIYARKFLGLSDQSNGNLLFLLEKNGAYIFEKSIGEKIDAYSLWTNEDFPFIMLGNIKKSAVRRNFDLAHELGHLLIHYKYEFTLLDRKTHREYEHEANLFAGEFLLPKDEFKKDFSLISKKSNPRSYLDLKKKWLVSIQAMALRAHALEELDYQQYRYFNILINKFGFKQVEPLDREIKVPKPGKIKSILELLFKNNFTSIEEILDTLQVDINFLYRLTGIDLEFFNKYKSNDFKEFNLKDLNFKAK